MTEYTFWQLIDPAMARSLLESHQRLSGMAYGLFDGNDIVAVGWQDICVRFHRCHPLTREFCRQSNTSIMNRLREGGESFVEYRCPIGMTDSAMPIVIAGKHLATFFIGQFFYDDDPPDREFFIAQADKFGFDRDTYLAALDCVPSFTRQHIRDNLLFLSEMVQLLTRMGCDNLRRLRELEERKERSDYLNALLNTALNRSSDAVFLINHALRFVFVNEAACRLLGYSREVLQTLTVPDIDPDVTPEMAAGMLNELFSTGRQVPFETRHRSRDGRIFPVEISVSIFEHHGERFSLCLSRDITERKRMETELVLREQEFRAMIEHAPDPIIRYDRDGRRLYVNPATVRISGMDAGFLLETTPRDAMFAASLEGDKILTRIWRVVETGSPIEGEVKYVTQNGSAYYFHTRYVPEWDANGEVASVLSISRDITQLKKMEDALHESRESLYEAQQIAQREQMEHRYQAIVNARLAQSHKLEAVGTLAAGIAHDFNNILGSIVGYAEMAGDELPEESSGKNSIQHILAAGFRARDLVARMLSFARQSADAPVEPVETVSQIREALEMLKVHFEPNLKVRFHAGIETATILASPGQVQQIVMNLCINAADAMNNQGELVVRIDPATLDNETSEKVICGIRLTVSDNGHGMTPEVQKRIFDPFYTTKAPGKGTGLGLSVVYGIITQLGGIIEVHSQVGGDNHGTEFWVFLPLADDTGL